MSARLLRHLRPPAVRRRLGSACATGGAPSKSTSYMVSSPQAEFFKYGPAQAFGPDLSLKRGDKVTLVQKQFGYSRVLLADGTSGYVATEDSRRLRRPRPCRAAALASRGAARTAARGTRPSDVRPTADPLFDISDAPLPAAAQA